MNMHKVFIFNACILMSFPNVWPMEKEARQEDSSSEEDLYPPEDLQQLKETKKNQIIKLLSDIVVLIEKDIEFIQTQIGGIDRFDQRMERFSLKYAEPNLMKPRAASPDIVGQAKKRQESREKLDKELKEKKEQKKSFQKLAKAKKEHLDLLSLKELEDLEEKL